ncbi:LysR substrate-binding domain-containing protein [Geminicoccus roseus]|uniref:LysR substrate-binding domain-containing protein n=1 Tax=Geminicoccus roseus TaxID=404900 RepID=UPI00040767F1|nr:LysR substrate-binding domain-containing protein [Geminicoccus roseus]
MAETSHRLPPLNALRAFEAAGRHLTFRAAAEELGVTQGAVAQQVRRLEAHLQVRLFDRLQRRLALTDQGRLYHQEIVRAFGLIGAATGLLRPGPARVTISVTPTFAAKWLIPRLPAFGRAHPSIDLRILATETVSSFQADGIDLAVRQARPPFGAALDADLLFAQEIVAVCSPRLLDGGEGPQDPADLSRFVLLHDAHHLWPDFLERAFGRPVGHLGRGMRFNQTALTIDTAIAGQGLALASLFLVADDLAAGRLVRAMPACLRGPLDFYLLSPRDRASEGAARAVRHWLLEQRAAPPPGAAAAG